jgi:dTDP-4-amino-4,6-dideoxygalactose transaminase
MICDSEKQRSALIAHLKDSGIHAVFHYQSLHKSAYNKSQNENIPNLPNADRYSDCLLRLPFYFELSLAEQEFIIKTIKTFYT